MSNELMTIGFDVELALHHKQFGYIPATAYNCPFSKDKRYFSNDGWSYHRDNVSVEFQTVPASYAEDIHETLWNAHYGVLEVYRQEWGLSPRYRAFATFDVPLEEIEEANEMGCDPDFDALTGEQNPAPDMSAMKQGRPLSGHIHFGHSQLANMSELQKRYFVQHMEIFWKDWITSTTEDVQRRRFYGKAGSYRVKPYGVEWRVPSAFNIRNTLMEHPHETGDSLLEAAADAMARAYKDEAPDPDAYMRVRQSIDQDG